MSRLPVVSADGNAWGTILNDFLSQAHNADGSLKNLFFNVKDPVYGAKGDGKTVTDGAITTGTQTLTSASAAFTAADAGKQITVNGAGAAAANLNTTISAYVNATTVTLAINAGTTVTAATTFYATDDTTAIAAAITAAATKGGTVFFPAGVYLSGTQTLTTNVHIKGVGFNTTTIKLKAGANADLFSAFTSSINFTAPSNGGGATTGVTGWSMQDLTLDGNLAGQTAGPSYPLRFYGKAYILHNLRIKNGYTGGIQCDWDGGLSPEHDYICQWSNLEIFDNNGMGVEIGGPNDAMWSQIHSYRNGSHNFHICPNAAGLQATNCHAWGSGAGRVGWLIEGSGNYINCESENSDTAMVVILTAYVQWIGGRIFGGFGGSAGMGIQMGQQAGLTPYAGTIQQSAGLTLAVSTGDCYISTLITDITHASGAIWLSNDGGNFISALVTAAATNKYITGTINGNTTLQVAGIGVTPTGAYGTGSIFSYPSKTYRGYVAAGTTFGDVLTIDTFDGTIAIPNGANILGYSDNYVTQTWRLQGGTLGLGQNAAAVAIATGGTIATLGIGASRLAPTANVTGIIMATGAFAGQLCLVINESAFTITFAASGTSHVASGAGAQIQANVAAWFYWNAAASLWYLCDLQSLPVQSATAFAIGAAGTIPTLGLDVSRLAPTAARTGITMQAGVYAGQKVTAINESANLLTYNATPATSLIANSGVVTTLPVTSGRMFVWDSSTGLWY